MLVDGNQLRIGEKFRVARFVIKHRVDPAHAREAEGPDQLVAGEEFLVRAGIPAEQTEKVAQRPGDEPLLPVKLHCHHITMAAFGDFSFLQIHGQRHMGKDRHFRLQCFIKQDLPGGVGHVVLTADDMGYAVSDIIDHIAQQVERLSVGADNDKILDVTVGSLDTAQHLIVVKQHSRSLRHFEANNRGNALCFFFLDLLGA